MMKQIHALAFGVGAFFAMNCGDGQTDYPEPSGGGGSAAHSQSGQAGQATSSTSATNAEGGGAEVSVVGHEFDPPEVRIKAGETVKWTWISGSHNVVSGSSCSPDSKFSSGTRMFSAGATFSHTFDKPGTYPYYCDPHCGMGMTGKVIVE